MPGTKKGHLAVPLSVNPASGSIVTVVAMRMSMVLVIVTMMVMMMVMIVIGLSRRD